MGNIAKARQGYKAPTGTVQVVIDAELAKERKTLLDTIDQEEQKLSDEVNRAAVAADGRPATPKLKKLRDELNAMKQQHQEQLDALTKREQEHVHKLRIAKLPGMEWADLVAKFPPRLDVQFDLELGYNHHAASIAAARYTTEAGRPITVEVMDDGSEVPLDDDDWDAILEVAAGWDVDNIVNLVINLNVLQASNRLGRLKKD